MRPQGGERWTVECGRDATRSLGWVEREVGVVRDALVVELDRFFELRFEEHHIPGGLSECDGGSEQI